MIAETARQAPTEAEGSSTHRFLRNIAVLGGSQIVTWGLTLAWTIVVPRAVGPTGIGELTTAIAVTGIGSTVLELGLAVLLVREIARDRSRAPGLLGSAFAIEIALFPLALLGIAIFIGVKGFSFEQSVVLWLGAFGMLPAILKVPMQSAFQAFERMNFVGVTGILTKLGGSVGGIALVLLGAGVIPLAALVLTVESATLWLNFHWVRRLTYIDWKPGFRRAAELGRASLPLFANYLIHNTYTWIGSVLLAVLTTAQAVGWYGISTRLLNTLFFLPAIVSTAFLPRLASGFDGDLRELQARARPTFELVLAVSLPIAAGAALVAGQAIHFVYGSEFMPAANVLVVLLVSLPFTFLNISVWQVLVASDRQVLWTKVTAVATALNIALSIALIRDFSVRFGNGALGAAAALTTTEILMAGVGLIILPRLFNQRSVLRWIRAGAATLGMAIVVLATRRFELEVEIPVGALTFVILGTAFQVFSVSELRTLRTAIVHRRGATTG